MKSSLLSLIFLFIFTVGCKKDPIDKTDFPYENSYIKLEIASPLINFNSSIVDMKFFDEWNGILITYHGQIWSTINKGNSWVLNYSAPYQNEYFHQVLFVDKNTGYVVGSWGSGSGLGYKPPGGFVLKTTDGGKTWTNILEVKGQVKFYSIAKNNTGNLFLLQYGHTSGSVVLTKILKSNDGGINWTTSTSLNYPLVKITFSDNFGFCYGGYNPDKAIILRSIDNGDSWDNTAKFDDFKIDDIKFSRNTGYFIMGNSVYQTLNYGGTWNQINLPKLSRLWGVNPLTASSCLIWGTNNLYLEEGYFNGYLFQTLDGGKNWVEHKIKDLPVTTRSSFYSSTEGFILAGDKLIKVTIK